MSSPRFGSSMSVACIVCGLTEVVPYPKDRSGQVIESFNFVPWAYVKRQLLSAGWGNVVWDNPKVQCEEVLCPVCKEDVAKLRLKKSKYTQKPNQPKQKGN